MWRADRPRDGSWAVLTLQKGGKTPASPLEGQPAARLMPSASWPTASRHRGLRYPLLRRRGDRLPSSWAVLHIWVVAPRVVAVVPVGLRREGLDRQLLSGLDIHGRGSHHYRGVRISIRSPIGRPQWPDPNADSWASPPVGAMPSMPTAPVASASMPTTRMPTLPRLSWSRVRQEQHRQHDDHPYPLLVCSHRDHHPYITVCVPCETPRAATRRNARGRCQVASVMTSNRPLRA
jgi:hypothetical protein